MYKGQEYNIFISYRGSGDGGILGSTIYSDLLHYTNKDNIKEFYPFFAPACIPKGENFKSAIKDVFEDVKCVVLLLTEDFFTGCTNEDDMVYYELVTALQNERISFIPIVFPGFSFDKQTELTSLFDVNQINRIKHINPINYHGIYDFKTEMDLVPVLFASLKASISYATASDYLELDMNQFHVVYDKKTTMGLYPQTVLGDLELIERISAGVYNGDTKINSNANTLTYNGKNYATATENPFNKTKFDNGKVVNAGARNYYVSSPISWEILFESETHYFAISEKIIDAVKYNLSRNPHRTQNNEICPANNWELSYVRRWLNNDFLYDAFSEEERQRIELVKINNTTSGYYPPTSIDTTDKVFLVSHEEIFRTNCQGAITTDYARARGAYSSTSASHYGRGDWWTRSPGISNDSVENIDRRGCVQATPFCNYVDDTAASIRPCIVIKK